MNDSFALLQARGELSSSVDPSSHQARAVENFMKTHGHPPFPDAWCPYNRRGQPLPRHARFGYLILVSDPQSKQCNMAKELENFYVQKCTNELKKILTIISTAPTIEHHIEHRRTPSKLEKFLNVLKRQTINRSTEVDRTGLHVPSGTPGPPAVTLTNVIRTAIPSELIVVDIQDQIFDAKALRKGEDCPMTEDQKEGMKGENMDTVTGLLLHTMSECYFKKGDIIDKVAEIQRWHKRFSEFSIAELTEIETSLERRSEEIIPAFDECLAKLNEKELHEGYKNLFIWTWKLHAMFSDNESKGVEKMNEVTQKYSEATKASEDKINILSNEMKKMKAKCTSCEKKIAEYKERTFRPQTSPSTVKVDPSPDDPSPDDPSTNHSVLKHIYTHTTSAV
ncbi:hypothetical protein FSP39_012786 [Pinctada imbricata]|uniref:Uncharacterized protein n=1 Tax=Pinctada imbricata TaxID=66713 RepID=A0AA88YDX7_PINIB|nr:hypothetical protein FSP39_012786 [Pinctada imbricata]